MIQEYLPAADLDDQRVLVLDGDILEADGRPAVIAREPRPGDFRSNLHAGARAVPGVITAAVRASVAAISGWLRRLGLFFVGLDLIGDRIIEVNAFSPGGLWDATAHQERDFASVVVQAVERRVDQRSAAVPRLRALMG